MLPFGCDGYMSNLVTFRPELSGRYWDAIVANDFVTVRTVMREYELPLWEQMEAIPVGWNAGMHALLEAYGNWSTLASAAVHVGR